jgi:hypothetical protein
MRESTTALSGLGRARVGPALRRTSLSGERALRVLAAGEDVQAASAALAARLAPAVVICAADVPASLEALLLRHPDVVLVDPALGGHALGGFRLVLDCVSVGVPVVVLTEGVSPPLARRLAELGVGRVARDAGAVELAAAVQRALALTRPPGGARAGGARPAAAAAAAADGAAHASAGGVPA